MSSWNMSDYTGKDNTHDQQPLGMTGTKTTPTNLSGYCHGQRLNYALHLETVESHHLAFHELHVLLGHQPYTSLWAVPLVHTQEEHVRCLVANFKVPNYSISLEKGREEWTRGAGEWRRGAGDCTPSPFQPGRPSWFLRHRTGTGRPSLCRRSRW